ncbi:MAG: c-type cytochrome [Deltaproteobacteria bacterium]|nr:c-type cytochrome [Deltaproteobacteria bacterium]
MNALSAFVELSCTNCHGVVGGPSGPQGLRTHPPLVLGGEVSRIETYGQLLTSIINPSHDISRRFPREHTEEGDGSRMHDANDTMTVAQLIDLTAYLHSKYERRRYPDYVR